MSIKPLGQKNYGSIPHLPDSRMGPGDHHCSPGQAVIATEKARDRHDLIIVQEKLDGSNVGVAKVGGQIIPLTRAGYHANTSPYAQHHAFAGWVAQRWALFDTLLGEGERVVGEWLAQAHGTRYALEWRSPFVPFDLMRGTARTAYAECQARLDAVELPMPPLLSYGAPCSITYAMDALATYGHYGALDPVEGAVWRVERKGMVDFLVKFVRPDKVDGCYLEAVTGGAAVWNWTAT